MRRAKKSITEAARKLAWHRWQKVHVGSARYDLLRRVARLYGRPAIPRLADEFGQMSVAECREFVEKIECWRRSNGHEGEQSSA